jgi:hypothetical protein
LVNLRLVQYIEKELGKNFPRDQIKQVLTKYNYKEEEVDEAFKYIDEKSQGQHEKVTMDEVLAQATPKKRHFGLIIAGIAVVIAVSFLLIWMGSGKSPSIKGPVLVFNDSELKKVEPLPFELPKGDEEYFEGLIDTCIRKYMGEEEAGIIEQCVYIASDESCNDECESRKQLFNAISRNQKTICQSIPIEDYRKGCHAFFENDPEKCEYLADTELVNYCRAQVNRDEEQCNILKDSEDCISEIREFDAIGKQDPGLCLSIPNTSYKYECLAFIKKDFRECYSLSDCSDSTYLSLAHQQRKGELCDNIINAELKVSCHTEVDSYSQ